MLLNFFFDFILLLSVSILLRRNVSIYKILGGSFIGGISILFLFFNINSFVLFLYKFIVSLSMILVTFGYRSISYTYKNMLYLYTTSIVLGGFLYFLNVEFSYRQSGLIFINNGLSVNVVFLIIFSPIIIYIYIKQGLWLKNNYSNYYKVQIINNNKTITLNAFMDTGNDLRVPFTNKPVILINNDIKSNYYFYIPYKGINNEGLIKCVKVDKVIINKKIIKNVVVGILNNKINIDGVDCLLNKNILEE